MDMSPNLDVRRLATMLGVHPKTIYRWVGSDPPRIPHLRIGRLVRFEPAKVKKWMDGQRRDG